MISPMPALICVSFTISSCHNALPVTLACFAAIARSITTISMNNIPFKTNWMCAPKANHGKGVCGTANSQSNPNRTNAKPWIRICLPPLFIAMLEFFNSLGRVLISEAHCTGFCLARVCLVSLNFFLQQKLIISGRADNRHKRFRALLSVFANVTY